MIYTYLLGRGHRCWICVFDILAQIMRQDLPYSSSTVAQFFGRRSTKYHSLKPPLLRPQIPIDLPSVAHKYTVLDIGMASWHLAIDENGSENVSPCCFFLKIGFLYFLGFTSFPSSLFCIFSVWILVMENISYPASPCYSPQLLFAPVGCLLHGKFSGCSSILGFFVCANHVRNVSCWIPLFLLLLFMQRCWVWKWRYIPEICSWSLPEGAGSQPHHFETLPSHVGQPCLGKSDRIFLRSARHDRTKGVIQANIPDGFLFAALSCIH